MNDQLEVFWSDECFVIRKDGKVISLLNEDEVCKVMSAAMDGISEESWCNYTAHGSVERSSNK